MIRNSMWSVSRYPFHLGFIRILLNSRDYPVGVVALSRFWILLLLLLFLRINLILKHLVHKLSFARLKLMQLAFVHCIAGWLIHDVEIKSFFHFISGWVDAVLRTHTDTHLFSTFISSALLTTRRTENWLNYVVNSGGRLSIWVLRGRDVRWFLTLPDKMGILAGLILWRFWNFCWDWMLSCDLCESLVYISNDVQIYIWLLLLLMIT